MTTIGDLRIIEYKQSYFYCDSCKAMYRGSGFLIPSLHKTFCPKHYSQAVKGLFEKEAGK